MKTPFLSDEFKKLMITDYDLHCNIERRREDGTGKGQVQGELVKNGVDIRIISGAAGLSPEQIEKLASTVNRMN